MGSGVFSGRLSTKRGAISVAALCWSSTTTATRRLDAFELIRLHRSDDRPAAEDVGLTLEEGKSLLLASRTGLLTSKLNGSVSLARRPPDEVWALSGRRCR